MVAIIPKLAFATALLAYVAVAATEPLIDGTDLYSILVGSAFHSVPRFDAPATMTMTQMETKKIVDAATAQPLVRGGGLRLRRDLNADQLGMALLPEKYTISKTATSPRSINGQPDLPSYSSFDDEDDFEDDFEDDSGDLTYAFVMNDYNNVVDWDEDSNGPTETIGAFKKIIATDDDDVEDDSDSDDLPYAMNGSNNNGAVWDESIRGPNESTGAFQKIKVINHSSKAVVPVVSPSASPTAAPEQAPSASAFPSSSMFPSQAEADATVEPSPAPSAGLLPSAWPSASPSPTITPPPSAAAWTASPTTAPSSAGTGEVTTTSSDGSYYGVRSSGHLRGTILALCFLATGAVAYMIGKSRRR